MDPPDGNDLYDANCLGCHGSPDPQNIYPSPSAPRKVIGARECLIKGAIYGTYVFKGGVKPMRFMHGSFTEEQIMMISDYLNSFDSIMGEQRFITTCAGCHGINTMGGRGEEDVTGEDAYDIKEAIDDERPMRFLNCLPLMTAMISATISSGMTTMTTTMTMMIMTNTMMRKMITSMIVTRKKKRTEPAEKLGHFTAALRQ